MAATTTRRTVTAKPRNDAYTGLLFISFLALVTSSILLFLDYNQYGSAKPPKFTMPAAGSSAVTPVGGAGDTAPAPGAPGAPAPMGDAPPPM